MKYFLFAILACLILVACQRNRDAANSPSADMANESIYAGANDTVRVVKTAALDVQVNNVEAGVRKISVLAAVHGGMITDNQFRAERTEQQKFRLNNDSSLLVSVYTPHAEVEVRVPSENLTDFLFAAAEAGVFTNSTSLNIADKSLDHLSTALKTKTRERLAAAVPDSINSKDLNGAINLRDAATDGMIANKYLAGDARFSKINLSLSQQPILKREVVINSDISFNDVPTGNQFSSAFTAGWRGLKIVILFFTGIWPLILLGVGAWLLWRKQGGLFTKKAEAIAPARG